MPISITSIRPKRFQVSDPDRTAANVRRAQYRYMRAIAAKLAIYPPKNPGSRYVRTFKLQRSWENPDISVSSDGGTATMVNSLYYSGYAEGPRGGGREIGERQTKLMRSRGWPSISDVAREMRPLYKDLMNRAIKATLGERN